MDDDLGGEAPCWAHLFDDLDVRDPDVDGDVCVAHPVQQTELPVEDPSGLPAESNTPTPAPD